MSAHALHQHARKAAQSKRRPIDADGLCGDRASYMVERSQRSNRKSGSRRRILRQAEDTTHFRTRKFVFLRGLRS